MAWVMDTYSMHMRHTVTAVVTGKPVEMGGPRSSRSDGAGCMIVTKGKYCATQDADGGNDGRGGVWQRRFGRRRSAGEGRVQDHRDQRSDRRISQPGGNRRTACDRAREEASYAGGYPGGQRITNEELLMLQVDVLLPAALENVITSKNASKVRAKVRARTGRPRRPPT